MQMRSGSMMGAGQADAMVITDYLPELGTGLIGLDVHEFPHY